jgi:hypothetical protein
MMRTTLDLPEDLHRIVASLATHTQTSMSQAAADLMRRGLQQPTGKAQTPSFSAHPTTGLPVLRSGKLITPEDVKALEDEP